MSLRTWTPAALSSERRALSGTCWRVVEAQHKVSTLKLVDTLAEQELLESLIERVKPPIPPECRHLHYLLATPFRYGAPYPRGSRFRRAGLTRGVYYAAASPATAIAETAFHRLLFFAESPTTPWPANAGEFTAFSVRYATALGLDLMTRPLSADRSAWTHPTNYEPCQALADAARDAGLEILKYQSVRDPDRGANFAILSCKAFAGDAPFDRRTWRIQLGTSGARAMCEFPDARFEFARDAFAADPRIAALRWERA
jgi:RES domain